MNCLNETTINQNNILIAGCDPRISSQINTNNVFKKCLIDNKVLSQNTQVGSLTNQTSLINKQTATGLDSGSLLMILLIIVAVGILIFVFSSMGGKK